LLFLPPLHSKHAAITTAQIVQLGVGRYQAGNPLWPLKELHDLHKPPFVGEPEFTPFDIDALRCNRQSAPALPGDRVLDELREASHFA
jgi:hypothetical protein